jgi:hypothetical protein
VVVDGAALAAAPADDQHLIPWAKGDEVALVVARLEADEVADVVERGVRGGQQFLQPLDGGASGQGVEAGDERLELQGDGERAHGGIFGKKIAPPQGWGQTNSRGGAGA